MTADQLVEYVTRRLHAASPTNEWAKNRVNILAAIPAGIHELARKVMFDPSLRPLLQQDYSVSLNGSGVGDLLAATGSVTSAAGDILLDGVHLGVVRDADGNLLVNIPHYRGFLRPQPTVFAYYCLVDRKIYTRALNTAVNLPTDIVSVTGPLTVTANFAPASVTHIPTEIEDDLVGHVVEVLLRKTPQPE